MLMVAHLTHKTSLVAKLHVPRQGDADTMVTLEPGPCFLS